MALRLWAKFDRDWGWNLARLLAYTLLQALFAVAGLQLVVLALVMRFAPPHTEEQVISEIASALPDRVEATAVAAFAHSLSNAPVWLLALGLPISIWYGSRLFVVLESTLCVIFRRPRRTFLRQNRAAVIMLALFAVLLPVIVLSATAIPHIGVSPEFAIVIVDPDELATAPLVPWLALLAGLGANFLVALVAYTLLTPGGVSWRAAWPGALVAALLSQGYLLIFPLYVRYVLHPSHFGSVAGFALVALVFLYAYGVFIVFGAELASMRASYGPGPGDVTEIVASVAGRAPKPAARQAALSGSIAQGGAWIAERGDDLDICEQPTAPVRIPIPRMSQAVPQATAAPVPSRMIE